MAPTILRRGPEWFALFGRKNNAGTHSHLIIASHNVSASKVILRVLVLSLLMFKPALPKAVHRLARSRELEKTLHLEIQGPAEGCACQVQLERRTSVTYLKQCS